MFTGAFNPKSSLAQGIEVTLEEGDAVNSKKPPVANPLLRRNSRDVMGSATPSQSSLNSNRFDSNSVARVTSSGTRLHHEQQSTSANGQTSPRGASVEVKTSKSEMTCRQSAPGSDGLGSRSRQTKTQSTRTEGVGKDTSFDVVRMLERGKIMT